MLTICFTYTNDDEYDRLLDSIDTDYYIESYNVSYRKGKSDGWKLKNKWGAKLDPFIAVYENDNIKKCFYSETGEDVIEQLKLWINDNK